MAPSADMERNVHPAMVRAVLRALRTDTARAGSAEDVAERLLAAGAPVPEQLHTRLLTALYARGRPAVRDAARHLLDRPRDPVVEALMASAGLPGLVSASRLAERWFHVGHTTDVAVDGRALSVRHRAHLGRSPQLPETLFVCAVYEVFTGAVTGSAPAVRLIGADGAVLPPAAAWRSPAPSVVGWRLEWGPEGPDPAAPEARDPVGTVRQWVALDPARSWRLADVAGALGIAPRSLQRRFTEAGTTFRGEVLTVRLDLACQLIGRTRLRLAEVAAAAGFTDHAHLTHRFRERFGCPPARSRPALADVPRERAPDFGAGTS
ncbi:helix-turn-helix domain-containing protein [Streptomyces sp. NPDC004609]|uniref:helix-turn-helix domain-containing protein n=1 Tax=Streptomyces sp. NPDC004609 TaxID=3364704 RepID=UPI00368F568A